MSELKGCPFCGGAAKTYYNHQTQFWFIQCGKCKLKFEFAFHDETEAAENWNMRADESAIDKVGRYERMLAAAKVVSEAPSAQAFEDLRDAIQALEKNL